jgi:TonB family protein
MNRLQKKCLITSAGFHLLLIVILFVGPAFFNSRDKNANLPPLDYIPTKAIDAALSGGGSPTAQPPAPQPQPAPPEKSFIEKIFTPDPPKQEEKVAEIPDPEFKKVVKSAPTKTTPKPTVEVNMTKVKRTSRTSNKTAVKTPDDTTEADARAERIAAQRQRSAAVGRALANLDKNLSGGTDVEVPGPGGASYANFAQIVMSIYDRAWISPNDMADDTAVVVASVTIARDGSVVSARITSPSGSTTVDASVRATLQRVKFVHEFPEGAKDAERTFNITFDLKAKRLNR